MLLLQLWSLPDRLCISLYIVQVCEQSTIDKILIGRDTCGLAELKE